MDERKNLILVRGENKTKDIRHCYYDPNAQRYKITFSNGKSYHYRRDSVVWYKGPRALNQELYRIKLRGGRPLSNIQGIFVFCGKEEYWHVVFLNGQSRTYKRSELDVGISCLDEKEAANCLSYLRALASVNELKSVDGELLLKKQYDNLSFVDDRSSLATYLNPKKHPVCNYDCETIIFPFGGNASQFQAVRNALTNQISVIQGPPGTGKTQTILNIISNLLLQGKTVEVVSNNNSAIQNVLEKLLSPKYDLGFLVASLGKRENKEAFISGQLGKYPDISSWERSPENIRELNNNIHELVNKLTGYFDKQERLACVKQELDAIELEARYFEKLFNELRTKTPTRTFRRGLKSSRVLSVLQSYENYIEQGLNPSFWLKLKSVFLYGIYEWSYCKNDNFTILAYLRRLFYLTRREELSEEIKTLQVFIKSVNATGKMFELTQRSLEYLRAILFQRYGSKKERASFSADDFWKNPESILKEYPIILSTTFSSRSSMKDAVYDYIIMDEASQVDLATGALALSCAENAVIVGDLKQLPNVIPNIIKAQSDAIFNSYKLPAGYSFSRNSFLKSICAVIADVPSVLLREHYRCHPKIIGFCNQKFYNDELIIMTEDLGENDTLSVYRTLIGNHKRGRLNQRQIDVTTKEVLPRFSDVSSENIAIIAPYRDHTMSLSKTLADARIEVDTVHKFQGREKDVIILNTVDDEATAFSDDSYLLNVAISRAKKKLCLVVSGNEQPKDSNIRDLISYIEYNNFETLDSEIYSVFDLLYQQYTAQRIAFLAKHKKISKYDSENLMYATLVDLLAKHHDIPLGIICHQSLSLLIRDSNKLNERERQYAFHPSTHVDFLIYNRISKTPVLAIEVDGFHYHINGSIQAERDKLKNAIFEKYQIPLLRLQTNGSGEIEKIEHLLFG